MSNEKKLDQLRRIDEELKCSICTRLIDDPHTLMCGHNFCGHCLMNWFVQKKACPTCRTPAIKQPIQNITLQKISQLLWPDNHVPDRKLQRSDWLELYPVQNQGSYIRDEDGEGVILRCSNCAWELDEELFCGQCLIYYDDGQDRSNTRYNEEEEVTDTESHHEQDEDLEDFVVEDDHIDYENLDSDIVLDDPSEHESDNHMNVYSSDNEENEVYRNRSNKRRRVISDDEDDSETNTVIPIEDDDSDGSINRINAQYTTISDEELDDEEDYPDDPFPREKCRFIDDYAEEDDDEEESAPKTPKIDKVSQLIAQAKMKAESSSSSNSNKIDLDSSDNDSGSDDDADYNF